MANIVKFEVGAMYWETSAVDHECVMTIKITRRTEKSVWFVRVHNGKEDGEPSRTKIFTDATREYVMPYKYSMAPVWTADRKAEPEQTATEAAEETAETERSAAGETDATGNEKEGLKMGAITFKRVYEYGGDCKADDTDYICGYRASNGAMIEKKYADGLNVYCWKVGENYYDTLTAAKNAVIRKVEDAAETTAPEADAVTPDEPETETAAPEAPANDKPAPQQTATEAEAQDGAKFEVGKTYKNGGRLITIVKRTLRTVTYRYETRSGDVKTYRGGIQRSLGGGEYICDSFGCPVYAFSVKEPAPQPEAPDAAQEPETADDNKTAAMTAQEAAARKMIHEQTTEYLLKTWESTTDNADPFIPTVRGWLMDELQARYPEAYDKWLGSETCEDAALRGYIEAAEQAAQDSAETEAGSAESGETGLGKPSPEFNYDFLSGRFVIFEYADGAFSDEYETDDLREARERLKEEWDGSLESGAFAIFDRASRQYIQIRATREGRKAFNAENERLAAKAAAPASQTEPEADSAADDEPDAGEPDALEVARILGGTLNLIKDNGGELETMKARIALHEQIEEFKRRGVTLNVEYDPDGRFVGVTQPKANMKFGELPESAQDKVKEYLRAYDDCSVTYERGSYRVSVGVGITARYAPDFKVCGRYAADDIFTPEERVLNYANEFYSYPPEYSGERDYPMMKAAQERGAKLTYDAAGNICIAEAGQPVPQEAATPEGAESVEAEAASAVRATRNPVAPYDLFQFHAESGTYLFQNEGEAALIDALEFHANRENALSVVRALYEITHDGGGWFSPRNHPVMLDALNAYIEFMTDEIEIDNFPNAAEKEIAVGKLAEAKVIRDAFAADVARAEAETTQESATEIIKAEPIGNGRVLRLVRDGVGYGIETAEPSGNGAFQVGWSMTLKRGLEKFAAHKAAYA